MIETERLLIREFRHSDLDSVHEYSGNPEVTKYIPFEPSSIQQAMAFLEQAIEKQSIPDRTDYELAVELKQENKVIGGCRMNKETDIQAHLGFLFNQKYWGYGFATETAKALVDFGFSKLNVHRIFAHCFIDNLASVKVLEKVGLVCEGRLRENMMSEGKYSDTFVYGILRHEWESRV
jgi:RimJ/RimL family protein N-acetyltransferase